jgi:hypothetical protein
MMGRNRIPLLRELTLKEAVELMSAKVYISDGKGIWYEVTIEKIELKIGKTFCLIAPVAGQGQRWVEINDANIKWEVER